MHIGKAYRATESSKNSNMTETDKRKSKAAGGAASKYSKYAISNPSFGGAGNDANVIGANSQVMRSERQTE